MRVEGKECKQTPSCNSRLCEWQVVADFNANPDVHGILVQLPLPKHIDAHRVTDAISLEKDVDGFHPANIGALAMRDRTPLFIPCTPKVPPCCPVLCWEASCVVLCCAVLCCNVLCCAVKLHVLCCAVLRGFKCCAVLCCVVKFCVMLLGSFM